MSNCLKRNWLQQCLQRQIHKAQGVHWQRQGCRSQGAPTQVLRLVKAETQAEICIRSNGGCLPCKRWPQCELINHISLFYLQSRGNKAVLLHPGRCEGSVSGQHWQCPPCPGRHFCCPTCPRLWSLCALVKPHTNSRQCCEQHTTWVLNKII